MNVVEDFLMHYGTKRHSGRYPWGSGDNPYQHSGDFLSRVETLRKEGWSETPENIMKEFGISTGEYRIAKSQAKAERAAMRYETAKAMKGDGYTNDQIAEKLGLPGESSVRLLLDEGAQMRRTKARATADTLKKYVDEHGMTDVGIGVEQELGVSREKLKEALTILEMEGYAVYGGGIPQVTNPGKQSNQMVLCPPGTEAKDIYNFENVHMYNGDRSRDGGKTFEKPFKYPESMDSKRLQVVYAEEGGTDRDGLIELRRGVQDLSLGDSVYSQVRILVDGTHYLKGMAVYADDLPDGVDVRFNTNKSKGTPVINPDPKGKSVLKPITGDPDNPFGAAIKENGGQSYYEDAKGEKHLSLINKTREEGEWTKYRDKLPSQFLSKQSYSMVKKQLDLAVADKKLEFETYLELTNPAVKRNLLSSFAEDCDSTAEHLNAAALPGQKWHVILPVPSMKSTEVYAPQYENGTKVALVRYPHGGTFEIPILTVNNKNKAAKAMIGTDSTDAICINHDVAMRLSGADFDGDTAMVIPTHDPEGKVRVTNREPLPGLVNGFDPDLDFGEHPGMKYMSKGAVQREMGQITNLIADMTLIGASDSELERAVKHSMVVIDAYKHKYDYKKSEREFGIAELRKKYQGHIDPETGRERGGAGTIITRAKSQTSVPERKGQPKINQKGKDWYDPNRPEGALIYQQSGRTKTTVLKDGTVKEEPKLVKSTRMAETDDAMTLVSDYREPRELLYANYANSMKALANSARLELVTTERLKYDASAAKEYAPEVEHLTSQLRQAKSNAPKEREAQRIANSKVEAKKQDNPEMTKKEIKKASQQALTEARVAVGAKRWPIDISPREWEAIQKGAISDSMLTEILRFADGEQVRSYATPFEHNELSPARKAKIKAMSKSTYTIAEIAAAVGASPATVSKYLGE